MIKITSKKCPHCNRNISIQQGNVNAYGPTITICTNCGKYIIDKDNLEAALDIDSAYDTVKPIYFSTVYSSIGCILFGFAPIILFNSGITTWKIILLIATIILGIFLAIYFIYDEYKSFDKRLDEMQEEINNSKKRLSNYEYALALKQLGYSVPEEFLNKNGLSFYNNEFKKRFFQYKHPYTGKNIESAQEYLDAIDSQQQGKNIVTANQLCVDELNEMFRDRFKNIPSVTITNMDDYLKAVDEHRNNS